MCWPDNKEPLNLQTSCTPAPWTSPVIPSIYSRWQTQNHNVWMAPMTCWQFWQHVWICTRSACFLTINEFLLKTIAFCRGAAPSLPGRFSFWEHYSIPRRCNDITSGQQGDQNPVQKSRPEWARKTHHHYNTDTRHLLNVQVAAQVLQSGWSSSIAVTECV